MAQGVLRGAGRPGIGAVLNSLGYWGLGVPLAALLGIRMGWGVHGFWAGLLATSTVMAVVQLAVISAFDWRREVQRTAQALQQQAEEGADAKAAALGAAAAAADFDVASSAAAGREPSGDPSDTAPLLDALARRSSSSSGPSSAPAAKPSRLSQASSVV
jgi:hypothetical protein